MGELFLAAAGETGGFEKLCVVKKVLHSLADAAVHRRFLDEAKVVVRLNHANLVQVFDAGKVDNEYYLSMELVEGKDLRAVWNRCAQLHRRIPVDVAMFVIREVLRGLDYVHDAMQLNLVHRDISPPNILVGYRGDVKLTDFGLAKSAIKRELTTPGVVFGRYSYLSPEQAKGLPADRRTDIYACAIVLWELLTGRQLFPSTNKSHQEALSAVRNPKAKPPSSIVPGVPDGMDDVVLRGLAKDPADRYETAGEFRAAISDVLARDFPKCDTDRVAEFMSEIFARECKLEARDYRRYSEQDFSDLRATAEDSELISISDVLEQVGGDGDSEISLRDSDIHELDRPGSRRWDEGRIDPDSLRKSAEALVGKVLGKKYRIDSVIGIGGMGAVFKATHLALGKTFALKVLHSVYTRDSEIIERFMREARAATQTGHPNIIDVVDIATTDEGDVYFVMELLEGKNLGQVMATEGPIAIRRAVHIARQICRALSAAHEVGIIHRDLKSENIILTARGRDLDFVKVLDFGICKQMNADSTTSPGLIMGSPDYMAPEQGAGLDATVASDVYSVGCILYEMLTGSVPFQGRNAVDVLMQKGAREAPRVTDERTEVPEALAEVVAHCLRRVPDDRPPSMRSLEYELTRAVDGRATAVAAVLGIGDDDRSDEAAASMSMARAAVASQMGNTGGYPTAPRQEQTQIAPMPLGASHSVGSSPLGPALPTGSQPTVPTKEGSGAGRALLFIALGGLLAFGIVAALSPETLFGVGGQPETTKESDEGHSKGDEEGTEAKQPSDAKDSGEPVPTEPPQTSDSATPSPPETAGTPDGGDEEPEIVEVIENPKPVTPEDWVARGREALERGQFSKPYEGSLAESLDRLRADDPSNEEVGKLRQEAADVLLPKGLEHNKKEEWGPAIETFRELQAVWPNHPESKDPYGEALWEKMMDLRKAKDYDGSLAAAEEILNLGYDTERTLVYKIGILEIQKKWNEASAAYDKLREVDPKNKVLRSKNYRRTKRRADK
jgi:serine/threonine protein kinase